MDFRHYPINLEDWQNRVLDFAKRYEELVPNARFQWNRTRAQELKFLEEYITKNDPPCNMIHFQDVRGYNGVKINGYGVLDDGVQNRIQNHHNESHLNDLIHECFETRLDLDSVDMEGFVSLLYAKEKETISQLATMNVFFEQFKDFTRTRNQELLELEEKRTTDLVHITENATKQYQAAIADLRTEQKRLQQENETKLQAHKKALEQEHQQRLDELGQRIEAHEAHVQEKQKELADKEDQLNAQNSKTERRNIRTQLNQNITEALKTPPVSKSTTNKRWGITIALGVLFAMEIAAVIWFQSKGAPEKPTDPITPFVYVEYISFYLRQTGLIVAAVATGFYYIKWQDKWFAQHADRDFSLKQFQLDMERASWVVEMALEWKQETQNELPEQLTRQLTNNLFDKQTSTTKPETSAADHIASALLGSASKVDLDVQGQKVSLDRKGVQQLQKTPAATTPTITPKQTPS